MHSHDGLLQACKRFYTLVSHDTESKSVISHGKDCLSTEGGKRTYVERLDDGCAIWLTLSRNARWVYPRPYIQTRTRLPVQKSSDYRMRRFCSCYEGRGGDSEEYCTNPFHRGCVGGIGIVRQAWGERSPKGVCSYAGGIMARRRPWRLLVVSSYCSYGRKRQVIC